MDPLVNIVPDIHDWIFLPINGNDFMELTEVSPYWNEVLENSKMMTKVKLSLEIPARSAYKEKNFVEIKRKMDNITRRYQNVSIDFGSFGDPFHKFPLTLLKILITLAPRLVELEVKSLRVEGGENKRLFDEMDLSKLKVLKLIDASEGAISKLLSRCESVTKLELKGENSWNPSYSRPMSVPDLRPFLVRNESLQDMELCGDQIYNLMFEESSHEEVRLKLKHLKMSNGKCNGHTMNEYMEWKFLKFLQRHSQSLESLKISSCKPNVMNYIFNEMPALTSLSVRWFRVNETQLNLNEKIVELNLLDFGLGDLKKIFQIVPNLQTLFLANLDEDILEMIASSLPQLQTMRIIGNSIKVNDPIWSLKWPNATFSYDETQRHGWTVKR